MVVDVDAVLTAGRPAGVPGLVAYYRVSKEKQASSGLGLQAQRAAAEAFAREVGRPIIAEYTEVETGTDKRDRPTLHTAIRHAQLAGASLVIAKLDRLSRDVHFLSGLMKSGVDFIACDDRTTNPLYIHIKVAMAEHEAKMISARTKDALRAYRENKRVSKRVRERYPDGVPADIVEATAGKLGAELLQCRNLNPEARKRGTEAAAKSHAARASKRAEAVLPFIRVLWLEGETLAGLADELNRRRFQTARGKRWTHVQVRAVLQRAGYDTSRRRHQIARDAAV